MASVLLAEDDQDIAFILVRTLKRAGHTVRHAADGVAALELAGQSCPDVVLTDLGMPRMDGLQLTQAIRAHPDLRDTPVAILTGSFLPADPRAAAADVCAVLLKPCDKNNLLATVEQLGDLGPHDHGATPSPCPLSNPIPPVP
jgi:CheY-like chemotaxis protein